MDLFVLGIFTVVAAIIVLIVTMFMGEAVQSLNETGYASQEAITAFNDSQTSYINGFNLGFSFIFFCMCIAVLFLAFSVRSHPVFFVVFIIALFVMTFVNLYLESVYFMLASSSDFVSIADRYHIINYMIDYLGFFIAVFGLIIAGVSYVRQ